MARQKGIANHWYFVAQKVQRNIVRLHITSLAWLWTAGASEQFTSRYVIGGPQGCRRDLIVQPAGPFAASTLLSRTQAQKPGPNTISYDIIRYHMISYDIYSIDCDPEFWALSGPLGSQTCRSFRFDHFCTEVVPTSPLACTWCNGTQAQGLIPDAVFLGGILGRCGQWCEICRKGCTVDIPSGNLTLPWKINSSNKSK